MPLFSFVRDAGASIFGADEEAAESQVRSRRIKDHLRHFDLRVDGIEAELEGDTLVLTGEADTLREKNRILATAGNVRGIGSIDDRITLDASEPAADAETPFYTVQSGDYLSKIAREVHGDANKYGLLFEANRPMLESPDAIYPGQVLVVPALED